MEAAQDRRPRAAIARDLIAANAGDNLKYTGFATPIPGAIPYPLALHNPYAVESLIDRNLRLLDICLSLRTQDLDYQKLAEDSAEAYKLFLDVTEIDKAQEAFLSSNDGTGAVALLAQKETEQVANGNVKGTLDSQNWAKARDEKLRGFIKQRRKLVEAYEGVLAKRRSDVNEGSNFAARQKRVEDRYVELLLDAVYRSWAISDGLKIVYGKDLQPPQPSDEFLDDLVKWHKMVVDEMEKALRRDTEYALVLNLRYAQKDGRHLPLAGPAPLATADPLASGWTSDRSKLSDGTIRFHLDNDKIFPDQDYVRFRGVGVSFSPSTATERLGIWKVMITPPSLAVTDGATSTPLGIPPLYIGDVRDSFSGEPRIVGSSYFNLNPSSGEWNIRILSEKSTIGEPYSKISDVQVTLLVATLPKAR